MLVLSNFTSCMLFLFAGSLWYSDEIVASQLGGVIVILS